MDNPEKFRFSKWLFSRTGLVFITFLVIAAFLLIVEHKAHLYGILPYALLVLCILLYWLIRREQDKDSKDNGSQSKDRK